MYLKRKKVYTYVRKINSIRNKVNLREIFKYRRVPAMIE
jgi:hypothetical protein